MTLACIMYRRGGGRGGGWRSEFALNNCSAWCDRGGMLEILQIEVLICFVAFLH